MRPGNMATCIDHHHHDAADSDGSEAGGNTAGKAYDQYEEESANKFCDEFSHELLFWLRLKEGFWQDPE